MHGLARSSAAGTSGPSRQAGPGRACPGHRNRSDAFDVWRSPRVCRFQPGRSASLPAAHHSLLLPWGAQRAMSVQSLRHRLDSRESTASRSPCLALLAAASGGAVPLCRPPASPGARRRGSETGRAAGSGAETVPPRPRPHNNLTTCVARVAPQPPCPWSVLAWPGRLFGASGGSLLGARRGGDCGLSRQRSRREMTANRQRASISARQPQHPVDGAPSIVSFFWCCEWP